MTARAPYRPRLFAARPLRQAAGMALKPYVIAHAPSAWPSPATEAQAWAFAEAEIAREAAQEGQAEGYGHLTLHAGEQALWLLSCWWAHGDILCRRLASLEGEAFVSRDDRPLMACVWETHVIAHENAAWIRHMMTQTPSPEAWRADRLPDGPR